MVETKICHKRYLVFADTLIDEKKDSFLLITTYKTWFRIRMETKPKFYTDHAAAGLRIISDDVISAFE